MKKMIVVVCLLGFVGMPIISSAAVTVSLTEGSGKAGSSDNEVEVILDNPNDVVLGVDVAICDEGNYLTCASCKTTDRSADLMCLVNESDEIDCCKLLLLSLDKSSIDAGTGSVAVISYDVSPEVTGGCVPLILENAKVGDVDDSEVEAPPSKFCFESDVVTTSSSTTSSIPPYVVEISPLSAQLSSNMFLQLDAKTYHRGSKVESSYEWSIDPASSIDSFIYQDGLFLAGDNDTENILKETIKVIDFLNEEAQAQVDVLVSKKDENIAECGISIAPSKAEVVSNSQLAIHVVSLGDCLNEPQYQWQLKSDIGSSILAQEDLCTYSAGENGFTYKKTDQLLVKDIANDKSAQALISLAGNGISIEPATLYRSCCLPMPYLLVLSSGSKTAFSFDTMLSFEPAEIFWPLFKIVWDKQYLWSFGMVVPDFFARPSPSFLVIKIAQYLL